MIRLVQIKEETGSELEPVSGRYEVFCNISDNASNGEVLEAVFPDIETRLVNEGTLVQYTLDRSVGNTVTLDWWNAPYASE